jgi:hypothetical protein
MIWTQVFPCIHTSRLQVKIFTQLSEVKKEDGPTLLNLMFQCFQDVGLTKWTNIVS